MTDAHAIHAEAPHIDVRTLPPAEWHARIFGSLGSLTPGGVLLLICDHAPRPLNHHLETAFPGRFGWEYLEEGPDVWRVAISYLEGGCRSH